jgi:hypothetical protein
MRFTIDDPRRVYEALVVAVDAARESPAIGEVGPWNDKELRRDHVIELVGPDEFTDLVVSRWLDVDLGFEVE